MELKDYLKQKNAYSAFMTSQSDIGGNIIFCNSGKRGAINEFTLGLDSFISILRDIEKNITFFKDHEIYDEKEWRVLGGKYFTNGSAKSMIAVQTKPLFSTTSKLIAWANIPNLDNIDNDQYISLSSTSIMKAINKLEKHASSFIPKLFVADKGDIKTIPIEARVIYSYLVNSFSHRKIQKDILGKDAPNNGGGFLAMDILHKYEINEDKKGILRKHSLENEIDNASGKYLDALNLLKNNYTELLNETGMKNSELKKYLLKFKNSTYESIKTDYYDIFQEIYEKEKDWMSNIENKLDYIKNEIDRLAIKDVIDKLKNNDYLFVQSDENNLATFSRVINFAINISNFINNFTIEKLAQNNIKIYDLFNRIKNSDNLISLKTSVNLTGILTTLLPFYYSVIKHCQLPDSYPIYYKYWYSCLNNILDKGSDYDSLTNFYRTLPEGNRSSNFCAFFGALGKAVLMEIKKDLVITSEESKEYKKIFKLIPSSSYIKDVFGLEDQSLDTYVDKSNTEKIKTVQFYYKEFYNSSFDANFYIDEKLFCRFVSALLTKPFVILTGLSGSGKTKLAQAFAAWICESEKQYCLVPVGADWTNREPLLGFPNALKINQYVKPDNDVLDLIFEANLNPRKPYFLILDEMNLSHVERYFADFLSAMESKRPIYLHSNKNKVTSEDQTPIDNKANLPHNLFIVGTVNIDETTYMFSPKVLDRANVIEFKVSTDEMKKYLDGSTNLDIEQLENKGSNMANSFINLAKDKTLKPNNNIEIAKYLIMFFDELKKTGAEFGYRSASEIMRFAAVINKIEPEWKTSEIIDAAIMQKLLPKVHGSRKKLKEVLITLAKLCVIDSILNENDFNVESLLNSDKLDSFTSKFIFPISFEKISRMYKGLIANGFTSYAEAN